MHLEEYEQLEALKREQEEEEREAAERRQEWDRKHSPLAKIAKRKSKAKARACGRLWALHLRVVAAEETPPSAVAGSSGRHSIER